MVEWYSLHLNGRIEIKYEGILGNVCAQCQTKIIHREFNYLDKSYILTKNEHLNFDDVISGFV